jgi:hypothetical protein
VLAGFFSFWAGPAQKKKKEDADLFKDRTIGGNSIKLR